MDVHRRIAAEGKIELIIPHVNRVDSGSTERKETVGEASGRRPGIDENLS